MKRNIEEADPILHGLQREAEEHQDDSENSHPSLGHVVGAPLDHGTERAAEECGDTDYEANDYAEAERSLRLMHQPHTRPG